MEDYDDCFESDSGAEGGGSPQTGRSPGRPDKQAVRSQDATPQRASYSRSGDRAVGEDPSDLYDGDVFETDASPDSAGASPATDASPAIKRGSPGVADSAHSGGEEGHKPFQVINRQLEYEQRNSVPGTHGQASPSWRLGQIFKESQAGQKLPQEADKKQHDPSTNMLTTGTADGKPGKEDGARALQTDKVPTDAEALRMLQLKEQQISALLASSATMKAELAEVKEELGWQRAASSRFDHDASEARCRLVQQDRQLQNAQHECTELSADCKTALQRTHQAEVAEANVQARLGVALQDAAGLRATLQREERSCNSLQREQEELEELGQRAQEQAKLKASALLSERAAVEADLAEVKKELREQEVVSLRAGREAAQAETRLEEQHRQLLVSQHKCIELSASYEHVQEQADERELAKATLTKELQDAVGSKKALEAEQEELHHRTQQQVRSVTSSMESMHEEIEEVAASKRRGLRLAEEEHRRSREEWYGERCTLQGRIRRLLSELRQAEAALQEAHSVSTELRRGREAEVESLRQECAQQREERHAEERLLRGQLDRQKAADEAWRRVEEEHWKEEWRGERCMLRGEILSLLELQQLKASEAQQQQDAAEENLYELGARNQEALVAQQTEVHLFQRRLEEQEANQFQHLKRHQEERQMERAVFHSEARQLIAAERQRAAELEGRESASREEQRQISAHAREELQVCRASWEAERRLLEEEIQRLVTARRRAAHDSRLRERREEREAQRKSAQRKEAWSAEQQALQATMRRTCSKQEAKVLQARREGSLVRVQLEEQLLRARGDQQRCCEEVAELQNHWDARHWRLRSEIMAMKPGPAGAGAAGRPSGQLALTVAEAGTGAAFAHGRDGQLLGGATNTTDLLLQLLLESEQVDAGEEEEAAHEAEQAQEQEEAEEMQETLAKPLRERPVGHWAEVADTGRMLLRANGEAASAEDPRPAVHLLEVDGREGWQ